MSHSRLIRSAVSFLEHAQNENGGFDGLASANPSDFSHTTSRPTIFFSALIVSCIAKIKGCEAMSASAARFLLAEHSSDWSWNYWQRGSADFTTESYPDDLDDTACALAALQQVAPDSIDGAVLGLMARQLVSAESQPGGPYKTWLANSAAGSWDDIDPAVNANIGRFLSQQGVALVGLQDYLTAAIQTGSLTSSYYVGSVPIIYFLSSWYRGPALPQLRKAVKQHLLDPVVQANCVQLAMAISAAKHMELGQDILHSAETQLLSLRQGNHWPAAALYYEPPLNGVQYYAGSDALSTAFALEALSLLAASSEHEKHMPVRPNGVLRLAVREARAIGTPEVGLLLGRYLGRIKHMQRGGQHITDMAHVTAQACGRTLTGELADGLQLGSLYGWIAYSIYDDILDEEAELSNLNLANWSLRQSLLHFINALPADQSYSHLVVQSFDRIDSANAWEQTYARLPRLSTEPALARLPFYGRYKQLAGRSWGHHLAASGTLASLGYDVGSPSQRALENFFEHFLIARQLHDDAHDWEVDLQNGRISAVLGILLKDSGQALLHQQAIDLAPLQVCFWEQTIVKVCAIINRHLLMARQSLRSCPALTAPGVFEAWINDLEAASQQALRGRSEARHFITSYAGPA